MRKKLEQLSIKEQKETKGRLFTAASAIKSKKQMEQFLKEILTDSEQIMLGRRVWIAQLLLSGYTHEEICIQLKSGHSTVRRISKWLDNKLPGYAEAVESKGRKSRTNTNKSFYISPTSFTSLRRRYPMHFLFFNIAEALINKKN